MTKDMIDLLHAEADGLDPAAFNTDELMRTGDRRLRRRRGIAAAALGSAAVVAALAVPMAGDWVGGDRESDEVNASMTPLGEALASGQPSYATGSTIHIGQKTVDVGRKVQAYVETGHGVVFTDGTGGVFSADGATVERVGDISKNYPRLESDESLVAWVEPTKGDRPEFAAFDQSSGEIVRDPLESEAGSSPLADGSEPNLVYAVDDGTVYLLDGRGSVSWNVETGDQEVLSATSNGFTIDDVANGKIAYQRPVDPGPDASDPDLEHVVGPDLNSGTRLQGNWNSFLLSDDGGYLLGESDPDVMAVWDASTGQQLPAVKHDQDFIVGYAWEDDQTFWAMGLNKPYESSPVNVLRCTLNQSCEVVVQGLPSGSGNFILPLGEATD